MFKDCLLSLRFCTHGLKVLRTKVDWLHEVLHRNTHNDTPSQKAPGNIQLSRQQTVRRNRLTKNDMSHYNKQNLFWVMIIYHPRNCMTSPWIRESTAPGWLCKDICKLYVCKFLKILHRYIIKHFSDFYNL